jgi:hypothetical protein
MMYADEFPPLGSPAPLQERVKFGRIKKVLFLYACAFCCFSSIGVANVEVANVEVPTHW